ncbi:carbonic anhydrase [Arsenicicoccus sp. oral taxon 190]|uniref:carbonic anhydrase n=1 Tax=Arsenicicoccus sp. oral taxon 190 TaxID=1658671 RepID=UPI00067A14E6|nr:carbonic anhydrase [Arsenicicoccus sp. oral taxon 190]AKT51323.1 carbonic anhydrase [Arsenicicoccus sp. oral taxon 190]
MTAATEDHPVTPAQAWQRMLAGNARFVSGDRLHPNQDVDRRTELAGGQRPFAVLFGCADSRVAAEMIFDQGLGDLFVVRTAGHVLDPCVIGTIEFGAGILGTPLIVVMGHDACGAVRAGITAADSGEIPGGYIRDLVEKVMPSVVQARSQGDGRTPATAEDIGAWHVRRTVRMLAERSALIQQQILAGRLAVVGINYALADGDVHYIDHVGDIGDLRDVADASDDR